MLPSHPNCSVHQAEKHSLVYYREGDEMKRHPGTDGRETQWENEFLPNYRLVLIVSIYHGQLSEWNGLIERIISYYHDYHINSFFLQDGQSLPILLETDYQSSSSLSEIMLGTFVHSNEESGYWSCEEANDAHYPNPYLVKLTRKVYELCPDVLLSRNGTYFQVF